MPDDLQRGEGTTTAADRSDRFPDIEEAVALIWADVLGLDRSRIDSERSDFFDLGGHSLLAVQVIARLLERFRAALPGDTFELEGLLLSQMFDQPTVAATARWLVTEGGLSAQPTEPTATTVSPSA